MGRRRKSNDYNWHMGAVMSESKADWHKYPSEKPKVVDEYLVTINYGYFKETSSAV